MIIGKRANQISVEMKQDLEKRNFRNLLLIMIIWKKFLKTESRLRFHVTMKKLPKPTLIAAKEYEDGKVYYKNPAKEKNNL